VSRQLLSFAALAFFFSGVPALIYQLTWQRILALHSGVGIYSVAMIVAAFMAGIGIGSEVGGRLSVRFGARGALLGFAIVELAIGGFALLSPWLYYDVLYEQMGWLYQRGSLTGLFHFTALLPPTCLMGMSLPLLVRALVSDAQHAGRTIGYLYGINGLGAALGALITPWLLIPWWGISGAIYFGVVLNLVAGFVAVCLTYGWVPVHVESTPHTVRQTGIHDPFSPSPTETNPPSRGDLPIWVALYAASGFCALGLEMIWFRLIDVGVKSTAFTFGTVLSIFLCGLSLGSVWGARWESRWRHPRRAFLLLQCLIVGYAALSVVLITHLPASTPWFGSLVEYWRQYEPFNVFAVYDNADWFATLIGLYVAFPTVLLLLPTMLMGISFAVMQAAVHDRAETSGRKVGLLQAANIAGGVAGSLVIGLVVIEYWGTAGALRLLLGVGLVFAVLGLWEGARFRFAAVGLLLLVLLFALPSQANIWRRMHGLTTEQAFFVEDATGVAALTPEIGLDMNRLWRVVFPRSVSQPQHAGPSNSVSAASTRWRMSVNGKGHSELPYGNLHTALGIVPAIIHPAPREVAVIGLGSGDTAWAASCRAETNSVSVFEICTPELSLLHELDRVESLPQLHRLLNDERVTIETADGRNALRSRSRKFDLIEADASRVDSAYGGNLFSEEFFRECAACLKPGGVMCTWCPTPGVHATFCSVFPHVLSVRTFMLIGSLEPIAVDQPEWRKRLLAASRQGYLTPTQVEDMLTVFPWCAPAMRDLYGEATLSNRDLFPRDEFHRRDPVGRALAYHNAGELLACLGHHEQAMPLLINALAWHAELPAAHKSLGYCHMHLAQPQQAHASLTTALTHAAGNAEASLYLGQLLLAQNQPEAAVPHLDRAADHFAANAEVALHLAVSLAHLGRGREAIEVYRRTLQIEPQEWRAALGLAWLLASDPDSALHNPAEAITWATQAVAWTSARNHVALDALAYAHAADGDFSAAIQTAEQAIDIARQAGEEIQVQQLHARLKAFRSQRLSP